MFKRVRKRITFQQIHISRQAAQRKRTLWFESLELRLPLNGTSSFHSSTSATVVGRSIQGALSPAPIVLTPEQIAVLGEDDESEPIHQDHLPIPNFVPATHVPNRPLAATSQSNSDAAAAASNTFMVGQLTALSASATGGQTSDIGEPNLGTLGSAVFQTGNWYGSVSGDGGKTFQFVDPFTNWYANGVTDPLGNFQSDQRVVQVPSTGTTIWYLQYEQGVRIAVANGTSDLLQDRWFFYNWKPSDFNFGAGVTFDYPSLEASNNYLYLTTNVFGTNAAHALIWRLPLSGLAAGASIAADYITTLDSSVVLATGAASRMYMGSVESSNTFRVFSWDDSSSSVPSQLETNLATTYGTGRGSHIANGPDGNNWLYRDDERAKTAWIAGNTVGFMWDSAQGTNRPYPFVRALTVDASSLGVTGQPDLFSTNAAWAYPAIAPNARGAIGGSVFVGSSSIAPEVVALVQDDLSPPYSTSGWENYYIAGGTNGDPNGWGDYLDASMNAPLPNTWAAVGFTLNGPPVPPGYFNSNIRPYFYTFGRTRDFPSQAPVTTVSGNGQAISNNDTTPQLSDGTYFGTVNVGASSATQSFVVRNSGTADLFINGLFQDVTIGGTNAGDFQLVQDILNSDIKPGESQTFQIRFNPTAGGTRNATVTFTSNDPQNSTFTFVIAGTGNVVTGPRLQLTSNGQVIPDGETSPTTSNGTDFGLTAVGQAITETFSIANTGSATLNLTGSPLVQKSGTSAADFTIFQPTSSSVAPGGTLTFQIAFNPSANGLRTATISIANNDSSQANPFQFAVQGTGGTVNISNWTSIGPAPVNGGGAGRNGGPVSGRVTAIATDPTNANTIYLGAAGGGVWKTTNGGTSWQPLTDSQATLSTGAIAVAPSQPNVIYVGTGEANDSLDSFYGRGVLKSTDGGATWALLGASLFDRVAISKVVVDPTNANNVFIAVEGQGANGQFNNVGVWHSTDGGVNWFNTTAGLSTGSEFNDLIMDPRNPAVLFVGLQGSVRGVYRTTNSGQSWTAAGNFPTSDLNIGRIALAMAPSSSLIVYASVATTGGALYGMLKSSDGGATWTQLVNTPNFLRSQGWYDNVVAVSPTNANIVYAGGVYAYEAGDPGGLIKTTNGGSNWTNIENGIDGSGLHPDHHALAFDAAGNLLDGNDGGIFRTTDGGSTWQNLNTNLATIQFTSVAVDPNDPNYVIGGSQDNGTEKYTGGIGWAAIRQGDGGVAQIDPSNRQIMYHTYFGLSLERSNDGGVNWQDATAGIDTNDATGFYIPYVMDPSNPARLLLGTNRLYETTNRGDNWVARMTSPLVGQETIAAIGLAPSDPNTIYVAYTDRSVFVTTNRGNTWNSVMSGLPTASLAAAAASSGGGGDGGEDEGDGGEMLPRADAGSFGVGQILVDPTNAQVAYYVRDQFGGGHVFKTTNGGGNWVNISGNLPDIPTHAIALDTRQATSALYVGTDQGVFQSINGGQSWSLYGSGLPNTVVANLVLSTSKNFLLAGTHGRGAWIINLSATSASPHVVVSGNGQSISDGATVPSVTNGTDFGSNAVGSSVFKTYTISNSGTGALTLGSVSVSGSSDFTVFSQPASSVGAGSSTSFTIQFAPSGAGSRTTTVSFSDNDNSQPNPFNFVVGGSGTVSSPHIAVSGNGQSIADGATVPSSFNGTDFGFIDVGTGAFRTYTISNSGTGTLTLGSVGIFGSSDFTVFSQPVSSVGSGGSTSFTIQFVPSTSGGRTATVYFNDNDTSQASPFSFAVGGTGNVSAPHIAVSGNGQSIADGSTSPSSFNGTDFGFADVGTAASHTFTIANSGGGTLSLGTVAISGSGDFTVASQPSGSVGAGGSTSFTVRFAPSSTGSRTATVSFSDNDSSQANPFNFVIGGTGTASSPHVVALIDDPQASFGGTWTAYTTTGYNRSQHNAAAGTGTSTAAYTFSGLSPGQYQVLATWPANTNHSSGVPYKFYDGGVPAGSVLVNQRPAPNGQLFAKFQQIITVNLQSSTLSVVMTNNTSTGSVVADAIELVQGGTLVNAPLLALSSSSLAIAPGETVTGSAAVGGAPLVVTFTIRNGGNAALNLTGSPMVQVSGTNASDVRITQPQQNSLTPNTSTTFQLSFSPGAVGTRTAKLTIPSNDPLQPAFTVNLLGTGTNGPPLTVVATADDPQASFAGVWKTYANGFNGSLHNASAGTGTSTATYTFTGLSPGQYRVLATWPAGINHSSGVPYTVFDGGTPVGSASINQRPAPDGKLVAKFQQVIIVNIQSSTLSVVIANNTSTGSVIADAIKLAQGGAGAAALPPTLSANLKATGTAFTTAAPLNSRAAAKQQPTANHRPSAVPPVPSDSAAEKKLGYESNDKDELYATLAKDILRIKRR